MPLRCKDGDLAVITWDYAGCLKNIGRIVMVRGPAREGELGPAWRICPITENVYAFLERDNTIKSEHVGWRSRIDHPDAWMLPIRPPSGERGMKADDMHEMTGTYSGDHEQAC